MDYCVVFIGVVNGSVFLGYFSYTSFQKKDNSRRARVIQCAHVLCPNITMSIVFILWGVTEGFLTEAATCSALNFVRILFLFWIAVHLKSVEDYVHEVMDRLAVLLQYIVITVVAYSPIIVDLWNKTDNIGKVLVLTFLFLGSLLVSLHAVAVVCYRRNLQKVTDQSYVNTEITNFLRLCAIIWTYGLQLNHLPVLLFPLLAIICFKVCVHCKCPIPVLHFVSVLLILQIMSVSGSIYIHYDLVTNMKGKRDILTWITVFLHILTVIIMFASLHNFTVNRHPESGSRNTVTLPVWCVVVFVIGSVLAVLVNAAVLLVALILKARNGQHTVDLQVILIPTECVFAACWLALQISVFWKNRK
ncbi:hypothetical protein HF521_020166 [Silurus meridionalis]|uniref:Uncharacterized protein n=1 Tax=Silurus meridionalis TaxID=175797 RepID=A0A8T0BHJ4_SILME|nr:hypothetical protein HF521_020166 [Silurus meridionalis]